MMLRIIAKTMVRQPALGAWKSGTRAASPLVLQMTRGSSPLTRAPGRMFSLQQSLPRLPVPALQETLDKFLITSKPILSDEEFTHAKELAAELGKKGGLGEKLQTLLEERAKKHENWLSDWWLNVAYLEYRLPSIIHVNPGIMMPRRDFNDEEGQRKFAAKLIAGVMDYKVMIDEQTLPVEYMGKNPLCMKQFYSILSSCRIPGKKRDTIVAFPPDQPNPPTHIIVAHNNHFFRVDVYGSDGRPLSENQLARQLEKVVNQSRTPAPAVGILTTEARNTWGKLYSKMMKDKRNKASAEEINRAIFMVCLDNPVSGVDTDVTSMIAGQMNHGWGSQHNTGNRWFDKTIQFVVGSNGEVGLNYEHSAAEGPPIISLCDHAMNYVEKPQGEHHEVPGAVDPVELPFRVTPEIEDAIEVAKTSVDSLISDLDMTAFSFQTFGKDFIKSVKCSPDAFIQLSIQLAYHRLYGESCATYESGSLRQFQLGRTDTIRSCSVASDKYCKGMSDESLSVDAKAQLLRDAINSHRQYTGQVMVGKGIDRHLLGLKLIAIESGMDVPDLHMDPVYEALFHFKLSTSQVASNHNAVLCFGPVVPDGYGVCYNPMPDRLNFCVSAWNSSPETQSTKFIESLRGALVDGHNILLQSQKAKL